MTTATKEALDRKLQENGLNTTDQFCQRIREVISRHSPLNDLPKQIDDWQNRDYTPALLNEQIRPSIVSLRHTLIQKQYRCDGNIEQLERTRRAMLNGSAAQHLQDTIYVQVFVKWCDRFVELTREEAAVS